jgi:hypothetical protein
MRIRPFVQCVQFLNLKNWTSEQLDESTFGDQFEIKHSKLDEPKNYGCGAAVGGGGDNAGPRILPSASTAPRIRPYG